MVKHDEKADNPAGFYGLPSGQIKPGETALQTAVRKLENETGLVTSEDDLIEIPVLYKATIQRKDGPKDFSLKVFLCKSYSGELRRGRCEIPEWVKISDLGKLKLLGNTEAAVKEGMSLRTDDTKIK